MADDVEVDPVMPGHGGIKLTFEMCLCPHHGEPLRLQWPTGYAHMTLTMFQAVLSSGDFQDDVRREFDVPAGEKLPHEAIGTKLCEKPLCCRMEPDAMLATYNGAGIGVVKACVVCFKIRAGTPYGTNARHACFDCVVNRRIRPGPRPR